jgi:hypothetical protein
MFRHTPIIGGAPQVKAVSFDGTNDHLARSSITGIADGPQGTLAFWIRQTGNLTSTNMIMDLGNFVTVFRIRDNDGSVPNRQKLRISCLSSGSASRVNYISGTQLTVSNWIHVLCSWNTTTGASDYYFNDVGDTPVTDTITAGDIDYTHADNRIGFATSGSARLAADMAEFWFNTSYLDLSVEANRRKFIRASGKPEFLGLTGQRPTGSSPLIYLKGPASNWGTNSGTGGNFTVTGTFTDTTPPP